jgi:hypothetical protein
MYIAVILAVAGGTLRGSAGAAALAAASCNCVAANAEKVHALCR